MRNEQMLINKITAVFAERLSRRFAGSVLPWVMCAGLVLALSGCGDSPKATQNVGTPTFLITDYKGTPPQTDDTSAFMNSFWVNLRASNRCGNCHGVDANDVPMQSPAFVNQADINLAYAAAITVVDLADPGNSSLVAKVRGGHNCWTAPDYDSCADIIVGYIEAWRGGTGNTAGRQIDLTAPETIREPGQSRTFPATAQENGANSFANTVYPLLLANCVGCHAETSATPQAPFFANADVNTAYLAAQAKMDLDDASNSRFVLRLRTEFHNCWSDDCQDDADEMQAAISAFAGAIALTQIDPELITSKAMLLGDAIIASGGTRYENNLIALWEFKAGSGSVANDTSGVEPAMNLTFNNSAEDPDLVSWVLGYGIEIKQGTRVGNIVNGRASASTASSKKLSDFIKSTGEYSIEAWVVPANVTQEDSSIITYSGGAVRNFTMGQSLYNYNFINLTANDVTDGTGDTSLTTDDDDEDLQATLQHVVMNFTPSGGRKIYVNGVFTDDADAAVPASISNWNENVAFALGSEPGSNNGATQWQGKFRLVAIHNRVLSDEQIQQNFDASVGQKYYMLFSVADRLGTAYVDSYIMFEVEIYDNYSYLFSSPRFINLNPAWTPPSAIDIQGMRIGINGKEAVAGQAFANMNTSVTSGLYTVDGQTLSDIGTIIALEKGPTSDEFFLTFEQLGSAEHAYVEADPVAPAAPADAEMVSKIGVRTFDEINATMSALTGVPVTNPAVSNAATGVYTLYRRQFPAVENIQAFLSSHQMAVAQLAMTYCDQLVDINPGFFPAFNFGLTPDTAFSNPNNVLNPLLASFMNVDVSDSTDNLATQPEEDLVKNMLSSTSTLDLEDNTGSASDDYNSLIDCMTRCERGQNECSIYVDTDNGDTSACTGGETQNTTARTEQIVKAACTAVLGSAVMLIQ